MNYPSLRNLNLARARVLRDQLLVELAEESNRDEEWRAALEDVASQNGEAGASYHRLKLEAEAFCFHALPAIHDLWHASLRVVELEIAALPPTAQSVPADLRARVLAWQQSPIENRQSKIKNRKSKIPS